MNTLERAEKSLYRWSAEHGLTLLRIGIGVIFFWFGLLKFFPGVSEAEGLATETIHLLSFGLVSPALSLPILAAWEVLIGVLFLFGIWMRFAVPLLLLQMVGTVTPLFLLPELCFQSVPFILTLVGQYIIKNLILVVGALVIGAQYRGLTIPGKAAA